MTTECIGCFAYDAIHMKCEALSNTDFNNRPCSFRKDKHPKPAQPVERLCANCFANSTSYGDGCAILTDRYYKNCPFHKTRQEYERGLY